MMPRLQSLYKWGTSLKARITALLVLGIFICAVAAILATEWSRHADVIRFRNEHVLASAVDVVGRLQNDPERTRTSLSTEQHVGAQLFTGRPDALAQTDDLTAELVDRVGSGLHPTLRNVSPKVCMAADDFWSRPRMAGMKDIRPPDCWLLATTTSSGDLNILLFLPTVPSPPSASTSPFFLSLVILGGLGLAFVTAHLATHPLERLTDAANAFAHSIDARPAEERGPSDVRAALTTFNLMQERVREGLRERTRVLAAISHDLQTPLTRLRLRLEQVEDEALRARLIADLSATLGMVKRGMDLARSSESAEELTVVNLNSVLSSLADDAAESGHTVRFVEGPLLRVRVRPDALNRCLTNLIDNAVKYGGDAELSCENDRHSVVIRVRDHGAGLPDALLARVFEPFVRGPQPASSGDGTGIGLTIAKAQAVATGATLTLTNAPTGGCLATLVIPI